MPSPSPTMMPTTPKPTSSPSLLPSPSPSPMPSTSHQPSPSSPFSVPPTRSTTEYDRSSSSSSMPSPSPTMMPTTLKPSPSPTLMPSPSPTMMPTTPKPTSSPSLLPSPSPSPMPSTSHKPSPSSPSSVPPTRSPPEYDPPSGLSLMPSPSPTMMPTTSDPSSMPSLMPSPSPTLMPTTFIPSPSPSSQPSHSPTMMPSTSATPSPSSRPSLMPSTSPTMMPSISPTPSPSALPSVPPTRSPTEDCTAADNWSPTRSNELCTTAHHAYGVELCTTYNNPDYQRRLEFALANELYSSCSSTCVYDFDTYNTTKPNAFKWVGSCYNVQIGKWSCIDDEVSSLEAAKLHAATLCEPTEPCMDRIDWTPQVAESNCPAAKGYGGRDKGYGSAKICNKLVRMYDGFYERVDVLYEDSFNASLANHLFWGCNAKCLYDVEQNGRVYQWKGDCWEMQTNWACITTHANEYAWAVDYTSEDFCTLTTPAPVATPCVEREQEWNEATASNICASEYTGVTNKSPDASVCLGYEDYQYRLDHSLANRAFLSCDAWCVYDVYKRGYEAFIWRSSELCWKPVTSGLCIGGSPSHREAITDYIDNTLCASTTPEPTEAPTCRTQYEWSEDVADEHCTVAETALTYKHYSSIGRAAVPCADVDNNSADLLKSMAMALYKDCSSWCVYDFNSGGSYFAWKWNNVDKCWDQKEWSSCQWNYQTSETNPDWLYAMEAIALACTNEPTVSPTGCMPDYNWNEDRAAEVCPTIQTADKSFGVQVCTDANSASKQAELEKSLANKFFTKCDSWCVYDYDTLMDNVKEDTNNFGGFTWRNGEQCWKWVTCCQCFEGSIGEFEEVSDRAKELCVV